MLRRGETEEDYVEIDKSFLAEEEKVRVRVENLKTVGDVERIQDLIRTGNIVFLRIKDLKAKNLKDLKRAVDRLRKTCVAMNGDIVGIDEDYIVLCPSFARVFRGK
jgi:SepF-like predicted cell division protein (DUF552 family)